MQPDLKSGPALTFEEDIHCCSNTMPSSGVKGHVVLLSGQCFYSDYVLSKTCTWELDTPSLVNSLNNYTDDPTEMLAFHGVPRHSASIKIIMCVLKSNSSAHVSQSAPLTHW